MPLHVFTGPIPYQYPDSRDTSGIHLGEVEPGDVRDLDAPPDRWWVPVPADQGDSERLAGRRPASRPAKTPDITPAGESGMKED